MGSVLVKRKYRWAKLEPENPPPYFCPMSLRAKSARSTGARLIDGVAPLVIAVKQIPDLECGV
jgi:hypothetical protein